MEMRKINTVSIIIPTYNRYDYLVEILNSIARQTWPAERLEVVVVDDGSTDGTERITQPVYPFKLHYLREENCGAAVARNNGALHSSGDLLIFLDDDIILEPDYVSGLVEEHERHDDIVGMGCFLSYTPPDPTPFSRVYSTIDCEEASPEGADVDYTACVTNNLSILRDDFERIGGMHDIAGDGPTIWGDVEFGYRAALKGFRFRRSGTAACTHRDYVIHDLKTASARAYQVAYLAAPLFKKYPELRKDLPMFTDKFPVSWGEDIAKMVARKSLRKLASCKPALWVLERVVHLLETLFPNPKVLSPFYRWILGGYIFRGYRDGMEAYGLTPALSGD